MRTLGESVDLTSEVAAMESKVEELRHEIFENLTRWQRVQLARHPDRPYSLDYINALTSDFLELHERISIDQWKRS